MGMLNTSWYHMRRSPYQAMAAVLAVFITLLLSGIFFLVTATSLYVLQYFESRPQIIIFFKDTAVELDIQSVKNDLESTGKTASIEYITKDQALETYKRLNEHDPLLLEMVTADVLPASLEVSAKDPAFLAELDTVARKSPLVEEVNYQKEIVDALVVWTSAIRLIGLTIGVLLMINALLTIMTAIGMKIALRQSEIEILSLIGATGGYIRHPFILEGALYGAIGAAGAWMVILGIVLWLRPLLLAFLTIVPEIAALLTNPMGPVFLGYAAIFLAGVLLVGIVLGSIGSMVAVGRYLRLK